MSRTSLKNTKAEMYGLLWSAGAPTFTATGVDAASVHVYDHEPRSLDYPFNVTIAFGGNNASFWVLTVRIYANTARMDAKTAQDQLDVLMPAVEVAAVANGGYDPRGWSPLEWDDLLDAFMVACDFEVGRQDYLV